MEDTSSPKKRIMKSLLKPLSEDYMGLDLSLQGIRNLSESLFRLIFLKEINLSNNSITVISKDIFLLRDLEVLNLSKNKIRELPPEVGRLTKLKELKLSDNLIVSVPMELGCLYNLENLELNNNPLLPSVRSLYKEKRLIEFCRDHNTVYDPPMDRTWMDTVIKADTQADTFSFGTYNILCNFYAIRLKYAPNWVLNLEFRKENIVQEISSYNVDILCLQEIETYNYFEFYKAQLDLRCDYDSIFCPKTKPLIDRRSIDGCAIFWRRKKFKLIDNYMLDFFGKIKNDLRFCKNQDIIERNTRKDNIALIAVLEGSQGNQIIVCNVHLYWDPEFKDVKLLQAILLMEEIERLKILYKKASVVLMGDFNSLPGSSVYSYIIDKRCNIDDLNAYNYRLNNKFAHGIQLYDAYINEDITFTIFTPSFKGVIDYIFYSDGLSLTTVLSPVEDEYTERTIGLPNIHFPSDHVFIASKFTFNKHPAKKGKH